LPLGVTAIIAAQQSRLEFDVHGPASDPALSRTPHPGMRFGEFVALMAALMAVNALGIDTMLPALPAIGSEFGVTIENHRQLIIVVYIVGFGIGQLFYGPLADRYGRRNVLIAAMAVYAAMSALAAHATSFDLLLVSRATQGISAAATRVLSVSIIRDCYSGRKMARVMSLCFMTFLAVPVMAPSLGQAILLVAPWQWIFYILSIFSLFVMIWAWFRLPETLHIEDRRPISAMTLWRAGKAITGNRYSIGYTVASACIFGGLMGFINSSQQVFSDIFHAPKIFPIMFACVAGMMACAALINARIVERYGMRRVSHIAMLSLIAASLIHVAIAAAGRETIVSFAILQAITMFFFGMTGSNFNTMAMEPMGHIAGSASSVQGFVSTLIGAAIGLAVGQNFSGSTLPLALGFAGGGLAALMIVLVVEHGRLFDRSADADMVVHFE
jgi:DHA1 family bicyclomycin/chloramphenicol resistance-like MFS transporter